VASDPSESPEPASPSLSVRNFPFLEVSPPSANRCTWAAHVARQFPRAVASSLHVSDARVPTRAVRADYSRTAKNGNSRAALYGDFCPSPRNCLIGVEQAVVSSAAISISRHCPMWRRTSCRGTTLSVATAFSAPAPTCSSCWKPVLPNRWPTRTTRRPGCARLR